MSSSVHGEENITEGINRRAVSWKEGIIQAQGDYIIQKFIIEFLINTKFFTQTFYIKKVCF